MAGLFAGEAELSGGVEHRRAGGLEVSVEGFVARLGEEGGEGERVEKKILDEPGEVLGDDVADQGGELEAEPNGGFRRQAGGADFGRAGAEVGLADEVKGDVVVDGVEVRAAGGGEFGVDGGEELGGVGGAEGGDDGVFAGGEEGEEELLDLGVGGFGGVEVGADAVAAGELRGGHVGSGKNVFFLDLVGVEEDGEALGVEHGDDAGLGGHERAGRHVGAEDGGAVLVDLGLEEAVVSFEVVVVQAVFDWGDEGGAEAAGDFFYGKKLGGTASATLMTTYPKASFECMPILDGLLMTSTCNLSLVGGSSHRN